MKNTIIVKDNEIIVTNKFHKKAQCFGTEEYRQLREVINDTAYFDKEGIRHTLPVHTRVIKKNASKETYKNLTYENMKLYIKSIAENIPEEKRLTEYDQMRERSKIQRSPYRWMVNWFKAKYPNYKDSEFFATTSATAASNA